MDEQERRETFETLDALAECGTQLAMWAKQLSALLLRSEGPCGVQGTLRRPWQVPQTVFLEALDDEAAEVG